MAIATPRITLGEALKWAGAATTGGQAKVLVQSGQVMVNGAVERRRGRQLSAGDHVAVGNREYKIVAR